MEALDLYDTKVKVQGCGEYVAQPLTCLNYIQHGRHNVSPLREHIHTCVHLFTILQAAAEQGDAGEPDRCGPPHDQ